MHSDIYHHTRGDLQTSVLIDSKEQKARVVLPGTSKKTRFAAYPEA
jgi:hypothetical protein